jgi:hypothetical protein
MSDQLNEMTWEDVLVSQSGAEASLSREISRAISPILDIQKVIPGSRKLGRHAAEVLSKSAIVLSCAIWEAFVEDLAADALRHLAVHASNSDCLPKELRKSIVSELKKDNDELAAWRLADEGWRHVVIRRADRLGNPDDRTLSSPS